MTELDHVIVAVADLDVAAGRFTTILGRPPALRSRHARGTENAIFLFPRGPYLELLARWDAPQTGSSAAALSRRLGERGEGLQAIALGSDALDTLVQRLRDQGLTIADAVENSATDAGGRERRWRATRLPQPDAETGYLVQHLDASWRADALQPPAPDRRLTAAERIHHVAFDLADATLVSSAWEERFGLPLAGSIVSERLGARVLVHQAGEATIEFVGATRRDGPVAQRMAQRGAGLSSLAFEVADLDAAVPLLREGGIGISDPEPGVLPDSRVARIDPASACGVAAQLLQFG